MAIISVDWRGHLVYLRGLSKLCAISVKNNESLNTDLVKRLKRIAHEEVTGERMWNRMKQSLYWVLRRFRYR